MSQATKRVAKSTVAVLLALAGLPSVAAAHGPVAPIASSYVARPNQVPAGARGKGRSTATSGCGCACSREQTVIVARLPRSAIRALLAARASTSTTTPRCTTSTRPRSPRRLRRACRRRPRRAGIESAAGTPTSGTTAGCMRSRPSRCRPARRSSGAGDPGPRSTAAPRRSAAAWHHADNPSIVWFWPIVVLLACVLAAWRLRRPELDARLARALGIVALIAVAGAGAARQLHGRPTVAAFATVELAVLLALVAWGLSARAVRGRRLLHVLRDRLRRDRRGARARPDAACTVSCSRPSPRSSRDCCRWSASARESGCCRSRSGWPRRRWTASPLETRTSRKRTTVPGSWPRTGVRCARRGRRGRRGRCGRLRVERSPGTGRRIRRRRCSREARPIGHGARFHPPASGPVIGRCRPALGSRVGAHVELFAANRVVLVAAGNRDPAAAAPQRGTDHRGALLRRPRDARADRRRARPPRSPAHARGSVSLVGPAAVVTAARVVYSRVRPERRGVRRRPAPARRARRACRCRPTPRSCSRSARTCRRTAPTRSLPEADAVALLFREACPCCTSAG